MVLSRTDDNTLPPMAFANAAKYVSQRACDSLLTGVTAGAPGAGHGFSRMLTRFQML